MTGIRHIYKNGVNKIMHSYVYVVTALMFYLSGLGGGSNGLSMFQMSKLTKFSYYYLNIFSKINGSYLYSLLRIY